MKHKVITIGCEYGAGGPEIGKRIAQALGIEFYDRDLVDKVVEQIGVDRDLVKKADAGSNVLYSFETQYGPRYANLTNRVIYNQFEVIQKFAEKSLLRHHRTMQQLYSERPERYPELFRLCTGRSPDPGNDGKEKHWPERSGRTGEIS